MNPTMGERGARQEHLEFSEEYSKGELEGMGSRELLEAPYGGNFITRIVDIYVALDGVGRRQLVDYTNQLAAEHHTATA